MTNQPTKVERDGGSVPKSWYTVAHTCNVNVQNNVYFHKTLNFQSISHDLLNQNQACWYLFECIFHGDFVCAHIH